MMIKKQNCVTNTGAPGAVLGVHKDSQTISKVKPKIRIIHIFAPEIIQTDVANFRELVQRLTGKPTENSSSNKKKPRIHHPSRNEGTRIMPQKPKMELRGGLQLQHHRSMYGERIKGEDEIWRGANSGGSFLGGFAELEGFMEQLTHDFPPLLPMDATHMDAYGQSQLA